MKDSKKQRIYKIVMLIIVVAIVTFVITSIVNYDGSIKYIVSTEKETSIIKKLESSISTITDLLEEKYIGEVDEDALIDGALKGMVSSIGDAYTEYYTEEELEDFTTSTLGSFVGVGVYLTADLQNDVIVVIAPITGSPAEKAGIQSGDQILKADGVEYKAEQLSELSAYIKGEEGTDVELTIFRNGEILNKTIKRETVHLDYVSSTMLEDNIGYIDIATFDEDSADNFLNEYNNLVSQGAKSLIIDLRSNGGGLVDQALEIADFICDKGDIILVTADKDGNKETKESKNDAVIKVPIVVITDTSSASASEILAAALKDNDKAEIVGQKTFGKGLIQELVYLSNGGALKVTSSEYYTPNGDKINEVGIIPDYEIEGADEQLNKAKEILKNGVNQ